MKRLFSSVLLLMLLFFSHAALASLQTATTAGTRITNQATATYHDANGNPCPRVFSNIVTVIVKQVAGVDLQPISSLQTGAVSTDVVFPVSIANTGNGPDTFTFVYSRTSGWTPTLTRFFVDVNDNNAYDIGTDTPLSPLTGQTYQTPLLQPGESYQLLMVVTVPVSAVENSTSVTRIRVNSDYNTSVTSQGDYTVKVSSAILVLLKSHLPKKPKPYEEVTYTISVRNTGSAVATSVALADIVPSALAYSAGSVTLNGVLKTDAVDGDEVNFDAATGTVNITLATVNPGAAAQIITFKAKVRSTTLYGTRINNTATASYYSGVNLLSVTSNLDTDTCGRLVSILLSPTPQSQSGNPGDTVTFLVTLTNLGNVTEEVKLNFLLALPWKWNIILAGSSGESEHDDDDNEHEYDFYSQIKLQPGASVSLQVSLKIPAGTIDRTTNTGTLTGVSSNDESVKTTAVFIVNVTAPVFTLVKSVSPPGNQPPGTELTYTIVLTNTGTGLGTKVKITDPLSKNINYKVNSIKTGGSLLTLSAKTDAPDGDNVSFDAASSSVIIGGPTQQLPASGTLVTQFSAIIN